MNFNRSIFGIYHPAHKVSLLISDLVFLALAFYFASHYRLNVSPDFLSIEYLGLNFIIISSLFIGGAYTSSPLASRPKLPLNTFFTVLASTIPSLLFIYLLGPDRFTALFGRGVFPAAIFMSGVFAVFSRFVLNSLFYDGSRINNILLLGNLNDKERINKSLDSTNFKFNLSHTENLDNSLKNTGSLSAIVISPDHKADQQEQESLINIRLAGTPIFSLSDFFESFLFLVPVHEINNDWFIRAEGFTMLHSSVAMRVKRAFDILAALTLLIITLPITLITACLIKFTSPGPIFFSQTRVGIKNSPFILYKFRTMHNNAETKGAQWAQNNDHRITTIGRFLRKTRIDEIPQCWNIFKGEMSIIGPRPERPEFTSALAKEIPYYDLRHIIRHGITGWAQVKYPYGASTEDALKKLQYELYYIKNQSLLLDLNIVLRTLITVFQRAGR